MSRLSVLILLMCLFFSYQVKGDEVPEYASSSHKGISDDKTAIAKAWANDIIQYKEKVISGDVHSEYALQKMQHILEPLKKDILEKMDKIKASKNKKPKIINATKGKGFAAKYPTVLLVFSQIGSNYVLIGIQ